MKPLTPLSLQNFETPNEEKKLNVWAERVRLAVTDLDERVATLEEADSTTVIPDLAGDVTGPIETNVVEGIQGVPVSSAAPASGDVLTYDGSQWEPQAPATYTSWSPVLWRWDRAGVTQFNTTPIITSDSGAPPDNSAAIALQADATTELGPAIKISGSWQGAGGAAVFQLNSSEFTMPASGRCVIQYRIGYCDPNCNIGVFFHDGGSGTAMYGFGFAHYDDTTNALRVLRAEGTSVPASPAGFRPYVLYSGTQNLAGVEKTIDVSSGTPPPYFGTVYQAELIMKQGSTGKPPVPFVSIQCLSSSPSPNARLRPRDGLITDSDTAYAVEAGWQNKSVTKFGLCVVSTAIAAYEAYITDLQILVHPLDYPA